MKKLMMFAAAMTIVGSAFAYDVYDYKASVKNPDLKTLKITDDDNVTPSATLGQKITVTVKYIKSTSLFGYLVVECSTCDAADGFGYLVLGNKADKTKAVKILPADLLAKVWPANGLKASKSWLAEGYLFAGDGKAASAAPFVFSNADFGDSTAELFGIYNRPADGFADAWLDAAGFGATVDTTGAAGDACAPGIPGCKVLDTLSGSVIGGMFLCAPSRWEATICTGWTFTTDVVSGTWSIKRTTKVPAVAIAFADAPTAAEYSLGTAAVDAAVNGAIVKMGKTFLAVVPGVTAGPDFPRVAN